MLVAICFTAEAQQPGQIPLIGYLSSRDRPNDASRSGAIRLALRDLGYVEGQNIAYEARYANGKRQQISRVGR